MPGDQRDPVRDMEMFAVFREEGSVGVGDPYQPSDPIPARWKGKQMTVSVPPSGSNKDAMLDKTTPLRVPGDRYVDPFMVEKILKRRGLGKPVTDKPFKPAHPTPKSAGPGSVYGLLSPPLLDTAPSAAAQTSSLEKSRAPGKRNIYVSPPKRGTFGFPYQDRTIGGTRLDYMPDEYAPGRRLDRELKAKARTMISKPFLAMGRTGKGIVPIVNYLGAVGDGAQPSSSEAGAATAGEGTVGEDKGMHSKQWKPTNPPQKGQGYGCITRLEYVNSSCIKPKPPPQVKGFKPPGVLHERLSMSSVNPYAYEARQPPDNDLTLLK